MTVTRIDAYMVTCGGTCKAPHGYHLVSRVSSKWRCDCPGYLFHNGYCKHVAEVIEERTPVRVARCEAPDCDVMVPIRGGSPLANWGVTCDVHRLEVVR